LRLPGKGANVEILRRQWATAARGEVFVGQGQLGILTSQKHRSGRQ
jgi:hypothetical protein